ncbi:MAG: AAA family ATPase [Candidatus Altiarchaeota archaeon]|nr:AAA family ATPase [Candidatus Altiarchaeota archaeon]
MMSDVKILECLGHGEKTIGELKKTLGINDAKFLNAAISRLARKGYVTVRKPWFRDFRVKSTGRTYAPPNTRVIAVMNLKGGVGKTTTAVNLSAKIAEAGKKTLLVDMDPQASASFHYEISSTVGTYKVLTAEANISEAITATCNKGLDILPANLDLAGAEAEFPGYSGMSKLRKSLTEVADEYEYIIIDCPPSLSMLSINALCAAESVIVPLECDQYALESLRNLEKVIDEVRKFNPILHIGGILINKFRPQEDRAAEIEQKIRQNYKDNTYNIIIPYDDATAKTCQTNVPMNMEAIEAPMVKAYGKLAKEVINNG